MTSSSVRVQAGAVDFFASRRPNGVLVVGIDYTVSDSGPMRFERMTDDQARQFAEGILALVAAAEGGDAPDGRTETR